MSGEMVVISVGFGKVIGSESYILTGSYVKLRSKIILCAGSSRSKHGGTTFSFGTTMVVKLGPFLPFRTPLYALWSACMVLCYLSMVLICEHLPILLDV